MKVNLNFVGFVSFPALQVPSLAPKKELRNSEALFIQSEGLLCNRRTANVITRRVYRCNPSYRLHTFSCKMITFRLATDYIHDFVVIASQPVLGEAEHDRENSNYD